MRNTLSTTWLYFPGISPSGAPRWQMHFAPVLSHSKAAYWMAAWEGFGVSPSLLSPFCLHRPSLSFPFSIPTSLSFLCPPHTHLFLTLFLYLFPFFFLPHCPSTPLSCAHLLSLTLYFFNLCLIPLLFLNVILCIFPVFKFL